MALAQRLESMRSRYRRSVLFNWFVLEKVLVRFQQIQAGLPLDPHIDVVNSLGLTREHILARMPHNLRALARLVQGSAVVIFGFFCARVRQAGRRVSVVCSRATSARLSPSWTNCRRAQSCSTTSSTTC